MGLGLLSAVSGTVLEIIQSYSDEPKWPVLQHLLSCQGFVLFPILGVGAFVLPRFFGMPNPHEFSESRKVSGGWVIKASSALCVGALIIKSFFLEARGRTRIGPALRFLATFAYIARELPIFRAAKARNAFNLVLTIAFVLLLAGFAFIALFPAFRISLLHLTLVGGFALITLAVATRVIFGHSGNLSLLARPNKWMIVAGGLMWFAMLTRISGDFWPKIMMSHYTYGAIVWLLGVLLWSWKVLGKILLRDPEV